MANLTHFYRALMLGMCLATAAFAQTTIRVPAEQPTIQSAIDNSASGDTILVSPGTYFENITFNGKNVTLISESGPGVTTINGGGVNSVVRFRNGETRAARLEGFTITNGRLNLSLDHWDGGGIAIVNSSPTIIGNVITDNAACFDGGGIDSHFSSPLIKDNVIRNNVTGVGGCSGGSGGGLAIGGASSAEVIGNTIEGNRAGTAGGIRLNAAGSVVVRNNMIRGNIVQFGGGGGGGMYVANTSNEKIIQNVIVGNSTNAQGAGISLTVPTGTTGLRIHSNTIAANTGGPALWVSSPWQTAAMSNNIIEGSDGFAAVYCNGSTSTSPFTPSHNVIYATGASAMQGIVLPQTD